jgi:branched-chain amino acid transport system substrate-binding protein
MGGNAVLKPDHRPATTGIGRRSFAIGAAAATTALAMGRFAPRAHAAEPLKVAVVLPRSGFEAFLGQYSQPGADLAAQMLPGLGYPPVQLMNVDTESSVSACRAAAARAIDDGAQLLVGAFDSGQTAALAQVAEQHGVPLVINIGAADQITEQGYKYVFRNFITATRAVEDSFTLQRQLFAASKTTPKTVVMLHINDTFGTSFMKGIDAHLAKAKMPYKVLDRIPYDPHANDLSVEVTRARTTEAELLWVISRLNDAILLTREMVKQRWIPMGIFSSGPGWYEDQYIKTLGKYAEYVISVVPWIDPTKPLSKKLIAAFDKEYPGRTLTTNVSYTFEAVLIAADAYKRAGSAKPEALAEALRHTDLKDNVTIGPGVTFNAYGQNPEAQNLAVQNRDGHPRVILPRHAAEREVVFPVPDWGHRV